MPTRASNLDTAIDNVASLLAQITASPKPTYTVDGENYNWMEYQQMLIDKMLALEQSRQRADGPFEIRSQGV